MYFVEVSMVNVALSTISDEAIIPFSAVTVITSLAASSVASEPSNAIPAASFTMRYSPVVRSFTEVIF